MLTVRDLFAGLGGSSEGLSQVPGMEVTHAMNHWKLAMESHALNHPRAVHTIADISQVDPRYFTKTDILWGSAECTAQSQARGKRQMLAEDQLPDAEGNVLPRDAAERSRATMWDIPRFSEVHRYRAVITENVVDVARYWKPFTAWLACMDSLGYDHEVVYLNSMFAQAAGPGACQSRDRKYTIFWRKGDHRPDLDRWTRPKAFCSNCDKVVTAVQSWRKPNDKWGRWNKQYDYRCPDSTCRQVVVPPILAADTALNLSHPVVRLRDRKKPLATKTWDRVVEGWGMYHQALQVPLEGRDGKKATPLAGPWRTMTTRRETGILVPMRNNSSVRLLSGPFHTFCASGNHQAVALPQDFPEDMLDWGLRCIEPDEINLAMAFPPDYKVLGNKREQARLSGNAVTPPAARDLGYAIAEALHGAIDIAA